MNEKKLAKHWWAFLIRGTVAILFALLAFLATGFTLSLLLIFLGIYLLLDGLFTVIASLMAASDHKNWWILLLEGIISLAAGIFVFAWPSLTLVILIYIVAFWAIITGIFEFLASITATWAAPGKIFIGVTGVLSIILGIIILVYPLFTVTATIWLVGIYALIIGLSLIFFGFKLKSSN
ncbi:MAG: DUF308 domain-containing protein [Patescibacteria group bacterium]|nr:DUF308 domain-containing protein [Patescibacteria group bacterium]